MLKALLSRNFNVTALTRKPDASFPDGVAVKVVDYSSEESLTAALQGQDAVIDTNGAAAGIESITNLLAASVAAGVYRFVPSHYGLDPDNRKFATLPVLRTRKTVPYELVQKAAAESDLTYTIVACGFFLDFCLLTGVLGINVPQKKLKLFNGGTVVNGSATVEEVASATAAALLHPEETKNRPVYIASTIKSHLELVNIAKAAVGPEGWQEEKGDLEGDYQKAMALLESGTENFPVVRTMLRYSSSTPGLTDGPWPHGDNELLGVKMRDDAELSQLIKALAANKDAQDLL